MDQILQVIALFFVIGLTVRMKLLPCFGGIVGGSMAAGAWAVVSIIGSASTGTAIAGLSGVAATNATLAWFGGGAIAAGGSGMAGGMMVLGGIIAEPIIYFAAKGSYAKAEELRKERIKIANAIIEIRQQIVKLENQEKTIKDYKKQITFICQAFKNKTAVLKKRIYPRGFLSKILISLKIIFRKPSHSQDQEIAIKELIVITEEFLNKFNSLNKKPSLIHLDKVKIDTELA